MIKRRYDNRRLIVNTHVQQLLSLPAISKAKNITHRSLVDLVRSHVRALNALDQPVQYWDTIISYIVTSKLDFATRRDWENEVSKIEHDELPSLEDLMKFLENRSQSFELIEKCKIKQELVKGAKVSKKERAVSLVTTERACELCNENHKIYQCQSFLDMPIVTRAKEIQTKRLCLNCLRPGHISKDCKASTCKKCNKRHNTLLHEDRTVNIPSNALLKTTSQAEPQSSNTAVHYVQTSEENCCIAQDSSEYTAIHYAQGKSPQVILSTAQVLIYDKYGKRHSCRALLDQGSQSNIITSALAHKLKLPLENINISGVQGIKTTVGQSIQVQFQSRFGTFSSQMCCLLMPKITKTLPHIKLTSDVVRIPDDIELADPSFDTPGVIELLIGAGLFWNLLCIPRIQLSKDEPIWQKTKLGWIVGGEVNNPQEHQASTCHLITNETLNNQLEQFWRIEDIEIREEIDQLDPCEQHFINTCQRQHDGRYISVFPRMRKFN